MTRTTRMAGITGRAERLHLAGLTNAGVIIMGVVLGAAAVVLVLLLVRYR